METQEAPALDFAGKTESTARVQWMRAYGVLAAQFNEGGVLTACTLGPLPPPAADPDRPKPRPLSEKEIWIERRRIALAAGSSITPREDDKP